METKENNELIAQFMGLRTGKQLGKDSCIIVDSINFKELIK
jgi:hypothetical protein